MTKYKTLAEIRSERIKLYNKKEMLEVEIGEDFDELKESLNPRNLIKDFFTPDKHELNGKAMSPMALNLGSTVIDLLVSKLVFNKSSYIKKILSSYLIHATGPSVIQRFGPSIFSSLKSLLSKFMQKKEPDPIYEQSTAGNFY